MRIFTPALLLLACAAYAQPGDDPYNIPCGMASYDVPLQDARRNDVRVLTLAEGTDDIPSSSGNCVRQVNLADHADFLLERNHQGYYLVFVPKAGEVLHPDTLAAGIAAGRYRWGKYTLPICYQGYGAQADGMGWHLIEPRTWERSIVRLSTPDGIFWVVMMVRYREPDGFIDVRGGPLVVEGTPLSIR